jgi:hypothetical protein
VVIDVDTFIDRLRFEMVNAVRDFSEEEVQDQRAAQSIDEDDQKKSTFCGATSGSATAESPNGRLGSWSAAT